jgi:hypothetical protein
MTVDDECTKDVNLENCKLANRNEGTTCLECTDTTTHLNIGGVCKAINNDPSLSFIPYCIEYDIDLTKERSVPVCDTCA